MFLKKANKKQPNLGSLAIKWFTKLCFVSFRPMALRLQFSLDLLLSIMLLLNFSLLHIKYYYNDYSNLINLSLQNCYSVSFQNDFQFSSYKGFLINSIIFSLVKFNSRVILPLWIPQKPE